ncbi:sugar-binding transcriptional regulator [Celeribacter marinus]|uniref:Transcriptional regulator of mannitol utilization, DeoR family protein n=1 Tax=Celeribacter marinus TaxID=1397108 RepID=A0A0P0ABE6_9RHOB|nr:sugar-binding transcriptional regulator [Celeribacter marinus]ALI55316.1 transcriptional regulator of mannitol utilization, DeoR family protein [Celeribacter marinus]SFK12646.1 DNA-binding transcriptional regulator LsrR, DeoR family [Celeribacter marinus]
MAQVNTDDGERSNRGLAARAAWMSYVGGMTQDQIAQELGISRQRAQRLVARAGAEGLIRVRIDHPIAECLELERALKSRFALNSVRVAPNAGDSVDPSIGIATFAAPFVERILEDVDPQVIALGTGRTLSMVVDQMQAVDGSHHKLTSLIGNVSPDGSASFYEVIMRLAEKVNAPHYPMSVPVLARNDAEMDLYLSLPHVSAARALAKQASTAIVGVGQMGNDAPLFVDGFISAQQLSEVQALGAAGEICSHMFDENGQMIDHPVIRQMVGLLPDVSHMRVICIGGGAKKLSAIRAALRGGLISDLVTDEITAQALINN